MEDMKFYSEKMEKTLKVLAADLAAVRAGRANPAVLDKLTVDYYGSETPINQVASVSVAEARILVIQPWESSLIKAIEKAILTSDIGINPTNDGRVIRLAFPTLTEERRKELAKQVRNMGEESKVAVRNTRRAAMDAFKAAQKASEITEDDRKNLENDLQKLTDKYTGKIDDMIKAKENELMEM